MFAGEGGPERTNRRFHYVAAGHARAKAPVDRVRLGHALRRGSRRAPDIYGKVGNSGVSIATLDDAKKLYSGLRPHATPKTSVSMTINGPAPMLLAFFINAAIDQQCELYDLRENGLEDEIPVAIDAHFADKGVPRPRYHGELPAGQRRARPDVCSASAATEVLPPTSTPDGSARAR